MGVALREVKEGMGSIRSRAGRCAPDRRSSLVLRLDRGCLGAILLVVGSEPARVESADLQLVSGILFSQLQGFPTCREVTMAYHRVG